MPSNHIVGDNTEDSVPFDVKLHVRTPDHSDRIVFGDEEITTSLGSVSVNLISDYIAKNLNAKNGQEAAAFNEEA